MKKSDIIKLLKSNGFVKSIGTKTMVYSVEKHRYTNSDGLENTVQHLSNQNDTYIISKDNYNKCIYIEQNEGFNYDENYLSKISNVLKEDNIKHIFYYSYIKILPIELER